MATINEVAEGILEMFDGASVVRSTKTMLVSFLEEGKKTIGQTNNLCSSD